MKKLLLILVIGITIGASTAYALNYRLHRSRNISVANINAFFQIAVDRGAWPGVNTDIISFCGVRTATGGTISVIGDRSGNDVQMGTDRGNPDDEIRISP